MLVMLSLSVVVGAFAGIISWALGASTPPSCGVAFAVGTLLSWLIVDGRVRE